MFLKLLKISLTSYVDLRVNISFHLTYFIHFIEILTYVDLKVDYSNTNIEMLFLKNILHFESLSVKSSIFYIVQLSTSLAGT